MKKLIFVAICSATAFAGYRIEVGTEAAERGSGDGSYVTANGAGQTKHVPVSPSLSEEESTAEDTQILLVGTLLALAIAADAVPVQNDARHHSIP
jgi:hypothetical protein